MYIIVGTNEPYTGKVVRVGDKLYTTVGGAKEGFSKQVETVQNSTKKNANPVQTRVTQNQNPIIERFTIGNITYYNSQTGEIIPKGTELHRHQDGTIMTTHTAENPMGDSSVIVTTRLPQNIANRQMNVSRSNQNVRNGNRAGRSVGGNMNQTRRGGGSGGSY
jgi:hypothetical protein